MTFTKYVVSVFILGAVGCSKSTSSVASSGSQCTTATRGAAAGLLTTSTNNVIPVYMGDSSTTGSIHYSNEPLVSVTICTPNHTSASQCQTISNILLDTGSFGLRVFGSAIQSQVHLTQQTVTVSSQSYNLAECEVFGSGADWGPVQKGDVILGNLTASNISIHVINSTFAVIPSACAALEPDTDPCTAGYNGILGVGMFAQDCGADCVNTHNAVNPGNYFGCSTTFCGNTTCTGTNCALSVPLSQQVTNPIASFPSSFNNGLTLNLPAVAAGGSTAVQGTMTIGIGAAASNTPGAGVVVYPADASGMTDGNGSDLLTVFTSNAGATYGNGSTLAFLDSGSNGIFFPTFGALAACTVQTGFFCPTSTQTLSATIKGYSSTPTVGVSFSAANADTLLSSGKTAFGNLTGQADNTFDWGLPFFYNRKVYVGMDGTTATYSGGTATGPYWAF